jgi:pyrroline-5-carboxylate reductase
MDQIMSEIKGSLGKDNAVISIAAGVKMATLVKGLNHPAVIRVMPNTPAQIGAGMCVWTASEEVKDTTIETTRKILQTTGEELYVSDEKLVDMATALSASGPAYVFQFIEALIDGGVYLGMPRDAARRLAIQTVLGSVLLAKDSGRHPAELKDKVTSPGGTTAEALLALEEGGFTASVIQAVRAAYEKSKELGA